MKHATLVLALLSASAFVSPLQAQTAQPIPAWDHQIAGAARFVVLADFANAAVLDQETGLVWERTPSGMLAGVGEGAGTCIMRNVGGRMGWRLPSIYELTTLVEPNSLAAPKLPAGHPFSVGSKPKRYWSSTRDVSWGYTWTMSTLTGTAENLESTVSAYVWCVRAPSAENET